MSKLPKPLRAKAMQEVVLTRENGEAKLEEVDTHLLLSFPRKEVRLKYLPPFPVP